MEAFNWNFEKLHPSRCCKTLVNFQIPVVLSLLEINDLTLTYNIAPMEKIDRGLNLYSLYPYILQFDKMWLKCW